jgi:hypothetical protein
MIKPGEIQQKARAIGVRDQQIEKDYILSWILFGIAKHKQLSNTIVFLFAKLHCPVYLLYQLSILGLPRHTVRVFTFYPHQSLTKN